MSAFLDICRLSKVFINYSKRAEYFPRIQNYLFNISAKILILILSRATLYILFIFNGMLMQYYYHSCITMNIK